MKDNYRYKVKSLVRQRITKDEKLGEDVSVLAENMPSLYDELREVVCDE